MSFMPFRPPKPERVSIPGPSGDLEALVEDPAVQPVTRYGVVCHPHPQFGGTMDNKVTHTLARTFQELGVPTVRFNFRGVGRSMNDKQRKAYEEFFETDFSFEIPKLARFRVNAFNQNRGAGAVFRNIPSAILTLDDLAAPKIFKDLCMAAMMPQLQQIQRETVAQLTATEQK